MSETVLRLKEEMLRLPEEDRIELARTLWDSIEVPDEETSAEDAAWIEELDRRAADLRAGRATAEPVDQVFAELREEALQERLAR
jgi:putative addiction module component (TIGR02574 family)